jgi:ribosomal protein L19E
MRRWIKKLIAWLTSEAERIAKDRARYKRWIKDAKELGKAAKTVEEKETWLKTIREYQRKLKELDDLHTKLLPELKTFIALLTASAKRKNISGRRG